jgi:hypothetical protein
MEGMEGEPMPEMDPEAMQQLLGGLPPGPSEPVAY